MTNLTSNGTHEIFIQKIDQNGNLIWVKSLGETAVDLGLSIAEDDIFNIYVSGRFGNTVDFDPGPGTQNLTALGGSDCFLLKIDSNGDFLDVDQFGNPSQVWGNDLHYKNSTLLLCGHHYLTKDFDPGPEVLNFMANGNRDAFLVKYSTCSETISACHSYTCPAIVKLTHQVQRTLQT
ncbi:MAG: hypothetical protein MK066_14225 [Crocinitomicaceae bacterium]|nr:hypothetical protein [Crocinitomicaceae bacterium]